MPPIGLLLGGINFNDKFINLSNTAYDTLDAAKKAGAPIITYGALITSVIDFLIVAFVLFLLVKQVNRLKKDPPPAAAPAPTTDQKLLTGNQRFTGEEITFFSAPARNALERSS